MVTEFAEAEEVAPICKKHGVEKVKWKNGKLSKGWSWGCQECRSLVLQRHHTRVRTEAFIALGGKCATCGEKDWCVLQIDHINGDGAEEQRQWGRGGILVRLRTIAFRTYFYSHLEKYQLLCANCHIRKSREHDDTWKANRKWGKPSMCAFAGVSNAA